MLCSLSPSCVTNLPDTVGCTKLTPAPATTVAPSDSRQTSVSIPQRNWMLALIVARRMRGQMLYFHTTPHMTQPGPSNEHIADNGIL